MSNGKFIRFGSPWVTPLAIGTPSINTHVIDAANEGVAFVCQARNSDTITHLGFRVGTRVGTPPTYTIGLEGVVAATGFPDGVYRTSGGNNCTATFTPPADTSWNGTWQWIALNTPYTPTRGEVLCITIRHSSGTIDGTNNISIGANWTNALPTLGSFPYAIRNTSGTWAAQQICPVFGVRTANDRYGCIVPNLYSTRTSSTVGHRVAMRVVMPAAYGDTYKVAGIRASVSLAATTGRNPLARIWSASSMLASTTLDTDVAGASTVAAYRSWEAMFNESVTLNCGTPYYFGFEVADATSAGIALYGTQFSSADDNDDDGGQVFGLGTFNGTSWTDDLTVRPWMELILEDLTEPTGGGGGGAVIIPQNVFSPIGAF